MLSDDKQTHILYTPNSVNSTSTTVNNASDLSAGSTPTYLSLPATNPYNPFGSPIGGSSSISNSFIGRVLFGPTRTYDVESLTNDIFAGLDGHLGGDCSVNLTLSYGSNLVDDNANNNIRAIDMQAALNGTLAGYQGSYLNPFGPTANQSLVNALFVTSNSTAKDSVYDGEFSVSGTVLPLPFLLADHGKEAALTRCRRRVAPRTTR